MEFDSNNPVIKLCAGGMNAEAQGQIGYFKLCVCFINCLRRAQKSNL